MLSANLALAQSAFKTVTPINEPTYATCHPSKTYDSLIDGKTVAYPPWKQPLCTVWVDKTQFSILLEKKTTTRDGGQEIGMYFSRSVGAQVDIPRSVDVFSGPTKDALQRVGTINIDNEKYDNNSSHWISAPAQWIDHYTLLVFYSSARFTSLEEIKVGPQSNVAPKAPAISRIEVNPGNTIAQLPVINQPPASSLVQSIAPAANEAACALSTCIQASSEKYQAGIIDRYKEKLTSGVAPTPTTFKADWAINPFSALPVYSAENTTPVKSGQTMVLSAAKGAYLSALVVINHPSTSALPVTVALSDDDHGVTTNATTLRKVLTVQNRGNLLALDPLRKIKNTITCEDKAYCYLWIDINTSTLAEGRHVLRPKLSSSYGNISLALEVNVAKVNANDMVESFTSNHWGYTTDKPIFAPARKKVIAALHESGNRIYPIHPNLIPQPNQPWDLKRETMLKATLADLPSDSTVLLYLGWGSVGGTQRWFTAEQVGTPAFTQTLNEWTDKISALMKTYNFKAWYIYPVDELKQADFSTFPTLVKTIAQNKNAPKVYLTLTDSKILAPYTAGQIAELSKTLDLMQINLEVIKRFTSALASSPPYWAYVNPPSPVKAAVPFDKYLFPSLDAMLAGASGFGIYSLSHTGNSSAWDDFDGKEPDWAMVYEATSDDDEAYVPSRRWHAFNEGIQIARVLSYCNKIDELKKLAPPLDYEKVETLKTTVLAQCQTK